MSAKNTSKPAKKAGATVSKKPVTSKKVAPKKSTPPVKKTEKVTKKPVAQKVTKPVVVAKKTAKPAPKAKPVATKKVPAPKAPVVAKKTAKPAPKAPKVASKKAVSAKPEAVLVAKPRKAPVMRHETPTHGAMYVRAGRHFYTEDRSILEMPELIAAQLDSYKTFVEYGLREALESVFPISDFSEERVEIHFKDFEIEAPRYTPKECRRKNLNYESYLRVKLQMLNKETGEIKEDTVFLGAIPVMTEKGTFIINGVERVIVHQIIKADGISFEADAGVYTAKIKPKKGAWLEFSVDKKGIITVRIDKKRKMSATTLLRAFGLDKDTEIIRAFSANKDLVAKYIQPTLDKDKTKKQVEAWHALYKLIRPGDLGTDERVEDLFRTMFANPKRFDLGEVARLKMARKLGVNNVYE